MLIYFNAQLTVFKFTQCRFTFVNSAPWYTSVLCLKMKGHRLEHLYIKTGLVVHKEMYYEHMKHYKASLSTAKTHYYAGLIHSGEGNSRILFSVMNAIVKPPDSFSLLMYNINQ